MNYFTLKNVKRTKKWFNIITLLYFGLGTIDYFLLSGKILHFCISIDSNWVENIYFMSSAPATLIGLLSENMIDNGWIFSLIGQIVVTLIVLYTIDYIFSLISTFVKS